MADNPFVIITSKGHLPRMRAHRILLDAGYDHFVIVIDNPDQKLNCVKSGIPIRNIVMTGEPPDDVPPQDRIAWKREWIETNLVPLGNWYVTLDDNVSGWTHLPEPWNQTESIDFDYPPTTNSTVTWRQLFNTPAPLNTVIERWNELIARCEQRGTVMGGFAIENNFFFRGRKWQSQGYVRTSNAVIKNVGLPFYYWRGAMQEDMIRSVDVVARYGSVVVNRFVKVQKPPFEEGGIGSFEERKPNLIACSNEMMRRWPGLLRRNKGQDYQLTFAVRGKRLDEWRRNNGFMEVM